MYTTETGKHYNPGYTPLLFFPGEAFVGKTCEVTDSIFTAQKGKMKKMNGDCGEADFSSL